MIIGSRDYYLFIKNIMFKKSLRFSSMSLGLVLAFSLALPALAQTTSAGATTTTATKIACVGTAVATREATIDAAVTAHTDAVNAAYKTRAIELAGAYSNTTAKAVQAGAKVSWADFSKSVKSATTKWKSARDSAWSIFRTSAKACKAPVGVSDSTNSSVEVSGQ